MASDLCDHNLNNAYSSEHIKSCLVVEESMHKAIEKEDADSDKIVNFINFTRQYFPVIARVIQKIIPAEQLSENHILLLEGLATNFSCFATQEIVYKKWCNSLSIRFGANLNYYIVANFSIPKGKDNPNMTVHYHDSETNKKVCSISTTKSYERKGPVFLVQAGLNSGDAIRKSLEYCKSHIDLIERINALEVEMRRIFPKVNQPIEQ